MNRIISLSLAAVFIIVNISCSSTKGLDSGIDDKYSLKLGIITEDKIDNFLQRVTSVYGYEIARNERYSSLGGFYVESYWTERETFEDEKELGFDEVQTQVIFTSKLLKNRRADLSYSTAYYEIDVKISQKGKKLYAKDFEKFSFTDSGKEYAKNLAYEFKDYITGSLLQ